MLASPLVQLLESSPVQLVSDAELQEDFQHICVKHKVTIARNLSGCNFLSKIKYMSKDFFLNMSKDLNSISKETV